MATQGTEIVDLEYFRNVKAAIDGVDTCADLQALAAEVRQAIADAQAGIAAELAKIQPMLALLELPGANLGQIVTYLKKLADNLITPIIKPYTLYAQQLAAILVELGEIASAIDAAANRIGNCKVSFT